ncbi:MAG: type II toxin-antitoxin system HicA family toxin [Haloarculaceae archaeon]
MARGTFSGYDVVKVMVNSGIYEWVRTNGDHAILRWDPPDNHDSDARTVPVPLHDELDTGTLRSIGEQAGMKDFDEFREWIERNS